MVKGKYGDTILDFGRSELADYIHSTLAMDHNSASLTEVARYFGRDVSRISNGVRQLRERSNEDKRFRQRITRLGERLMQTKMATS